MWEPNIVSRLPQNGTKIKSSSSTDRQPVYHNSTAKKEKTNSAAEVSTTTSARADRSTIPLIQMLTGILAEREKHFLEGL